MSAVGQREYQTQQKVLQFFQHELGYRHLGNWKDRNCNRNVEEGLLRDRLERQGREECIINRTLRELDQAAAISGVAPDQWRRQTGVQAAHIRAVEHNGPDPVRNGIALSGTVHWMFDLRLISFGDDGSTLTSPHGLPDDMDRLICLDHKILSPGTRCSNPIPVTWAGIGKTFSRGRRA